MFLASAGAAGAGLKKFYDKVSEYDKSNYLIIPLGETDEGKAVYARVPHDETGRLFSVVFWKIANMVKDGSNPKQLQDIFAIGAGQLPSVTPIIDISFGWLQYLSGKNPYDTFRGRSVIDDTTFKAGGGASLNKMIQWTTNTAGFSKFATYDTSKQSGVETFMQVAPWFSSVIKISNYGEQEKLKNVVSTQQSKEAKQTLDDRELLNKYVTQARSGKVTLFASTKYMNPMIKEALGGHMPRNAEEQDRADKLEVKFKRAMKRGLNDDPRVTTLIDATSNAQKKEILRTIKSDMDAQEFKKFRNDLLRDKIVSTDVIYGL
jgi:hypothetical protein